MAASADLIAQTGKAADDISTGLPNAINGIGPFCGTDKFGQLLQSYLDSTINGVTRVFSVLGTNLNGAATGALAAAQGFVKADQVNAESISAPDTKLP